MVFKSQPFGLISQRTEQHHGKFYLNAALNYSTFDRLNRIIIASRGIPIDFSFHSKPTYF